MTLGFVWTHRCAQRYRNTAVAIFPPGLKKGGQLDRGAPRPGVGAEKPASHESGPVEAWSGLDQNSVWPLGKPGHSLTL